MNNMSYQSGPRPRANQDGTQSRHRGDRGERDRENRGDRGDRGEHRGNRHGGKDHVYKPRNFEPIDHSIEFDTEKLQVYNDFDGLITNEKLLRGILGYGFSNPSKIQSIAIKPIIDGKDIIAQSQSGTGKTGAFTIGVLSVIDASQKHVQAIIMAHTRELALQIESVLSELGKYMGIQTCLCVGKIPADENARKAKNSHILVGTPGRIIHLASENAFNPDNLKIFVMDEADELLNRDFREQTKDVISLLPGNCQICVFSATLPREQLEITQYFMKEPLKVLIERDKLSLDLIAQFYIDVQHEDNKLEVLEDLYGKFCISQSIIYVNSADKVEWLGEQLRDKHHTVGQIHGGMDQLERMKVLKEFRSGKFRVLISTDLLARGIDIQQVGYVINYDIPYNIETYLHRIGRSGRYNRKGIAINLVGGKKEKFLLRDIERFYCIKIDDMPEVDVVNAFLAS